MIIQLEDYRAARRSSDASGRATAQSNRLADTRSVTDARIRRWLRRYVARQVGCRPAEIDESIAFDCYGLRSIDLSEMAIVLEEWVKRPVCRAELAIHSTIAGLALHLAQQIPQIGDRFELDGFALEIRGRQKNRITSVHVIPPPSPAKESGEHE